MSEPLASVQIDSSIVRSIVDARVQAAVLAELSKTTDILSGLVDTVCRQKVNYDGVVDSYGGNRYNLVEVMCRKAIEKEIKNAIDLWVKSNAESIRKQMEKELDKNKLARKFIDAINQSLTAGFYTSVTVKVEESKS
jgi:hypothetical protein